MNGTNLYAVPNGEQGLDEYIAQTSSGQLSALKISQSATGILDRSENLQSPSAISPSDKKGQSTTGQLEG